MLGTGWDCKSLNECCVLHISIKKNGDPCAAFSVENGVVKVLPFFKNGAKMFLSHVLQQGRLVLRLRMSSSPERREGYV